MVSSVGSVSTVASVAGVVDGRVSGPKFVVQALRKSEPAIIPTDKTHINLFIFLSSQPNQKCQIKIHFLSESKQGEERLITYRLEYMIHRNDGTFRRDVGSDASRPQDITVRVGTDGKILIERLVTIYSKQ